MNSGLTDTKVQSTAPRTKIKSQAQHDYEQNKLMESEHSDFQFEPPITA